MSLIEEQCYPAALRLSNLTDMRQGHTQPVLQHRRDGPLATWPYRYAHTLGELYLDLADRLQRRGGPMLDLRLDAQRLDRLAQIAGDRGREVGLLAKPGTPITADHYPLVALGDPLILLQQHGLADTPQPGDAHLAPLLRIVLQKPLKPMDLLLTTSQIGRPRTDTRTIRILRHHRKLPHITDSCEVP